MCQHFKIKRLWECSEPIWHMEFYFIHCNSSQWGSFNSKWVWYQLVKGSKGRTTVPWRSNVDRFNSSSTSICRAGTKFNESSCDCLSLFCCSGLCTTFMWQFRFLLEVNVLMQLGHRRFWWSFFGFSLWNPLIMCLFKLKAKSNVLEHWLHRYLSATFTFFSLTKVPKPAFCLCTCMWLICTFVRTYVTFVLFLQVSNNKCLVSSFVIV